MVKMWFITCVVLLVVSFVVAGCGIPQEDYDAVVAERDAVLVELDTVETRAESLQRELDEAKSQIEALEPGFPISNWVHRHLSMVK